MTHVWDLHEGNFFSTFQLFLFNISSSYVNTLFERRHAPAKFLGVALVGEGVGGPFSLIGDDPFIRMDASQGCFPFREEERVSWGPMQNVWWVLQRLDALCGTSSVATAIVRVPKSVTAGHDWVPWPELLQKLCKIISEGLSSHAGLLGGHMLETFIFSWWFGTQTRERDWEATMSLGKPLWALGSRYVVNLLFPGMKESLDSSMVTMEFS